MLAAVLKGKLSAEQENMEDILTSNVFGLLGHLDPSEGLLKLLSAARSIEEDTPLAYLASPEERSEWTASYDFWPLWRDPWGRACEPDVYIELRRGDDTTLAIVVEAKFNSGKSQRVTTDERELRDQLARQWEIVAAATSRTSVDPSILYVTTHAGYPYAEIRESLDELAAKRPDLAIPRLLWVSWRDVALLFRDSDHPIHRDLVSLTQRLGLTYFGGISAVGEVRFGWTFASGVPCASTGSSFNGITEVRVLPGIRWSFGRPRKTRFDWHCTARHECDWRFQSP